MGWENDEEIVTVMLGRFLESIGKGRNWFTGENFSNTVSATARSKAGEYYARAPDA